MHAVETSEKGWTGPLLLPARTTTRGTRGRPSHAGIASIGLGAAALREVCRRGIARVQWTKEKGFSHLPCVAQRLVTVLLGQTVVLGRRVLWRERVKSALCDIVPGILQPPIDVLE